MIKPVFIIASLSLFFGCSKSNILLFEDLPATGWEQQNWISFQYTHRLPAKPFQLNWVLRHDNEYPYANIHLIVEQTNPKGVSETDTLSYLLAEPDGRWIGTGLYLKELTLPYVSDFLMDEPGKYTFQIRPSVRANDQVLADKTLVGIHQVGLELIPIPHD